MTALVLFSADNIELHLLQMLVFLFKGQVEWREVNSPVLTGFAKYGVSTFDERLELVLTVVSSPQERNRCGIVA